MSRRSEPVRVDERMLRGWPLPPPGDSKNARGRVVVIGGSERSPGAVMLAGIAALRVGAGRLTIVAPGSIAVHVAVEVPEAGVLALGEGSDSSDVLTDEVREELETADAVLVGPGIADAESAGRLVEAVADVIGDRAGLVLDAFALGALPELDGLVLPPETVLSPNTEEAGILLDREVDDVAEAVTLIASRYGAVTSCYGEVAAPSGEGPWHVDAGGPGLGTSGSGDVLAGAIAGLLARGADAAQAAVWATHLHATAGDRLSERIAPVGFLARDLCAELPHALAAIG
jgi:hydroxyethylthiazole kinase-like uncharacterized protein yjeF